MAFMEPIESQDDARFKGSYHGVMASEGVFGVLVSNWCIIGE